MPTICQRAFTTAICVHSISPAQPWMPFIRWSLACVILSYDNIVTVAHIPSIMYLCVHIYSTPPLYTGCNNILYYETEGRHNDHSSYVFLWDHVFVIENGSVVKAPKISCNHVSTLRWTLHVCMERQPSSSMENEGSFVYINSSRRSNICEC